MRTNAEDHLMLQRLGALLRTVRERQGLTQAEVAVAVGHSSSWLSRIEDGRTTGLNITQLRRIARVLDVEMAMLLKETI